MTPQQRENRIKAAEFLKQLKLPAASRFDMETFGTQTYADDIQHECGTSACAIGWMALYEVFPGWKGTFPERSRQMQFFHNDMQTIPELMAGELFGDGLQFWWPSQVIGFLDLDDDTTLTRDMVTKAILEDLRNDP